MQSAEHQQVFEVHQALKGLMLLIDEHTDLSVLKPGYLYFMIQPQVNALEQLLEQDGGYKKGSL